LQTVLETTRKRLVENLQSLIDVFTREDKQECVFEFLLQSLGLNPMLMNPFGWVTTRSRNKIQDLVKATP